MPLAVKQLIEVTGIAVDAGGKEAKIEFNWKWVATGQSKLLPEQVPSDKTYSGFVYCQLYDDGWRIVRMFVDGYPK